ncbi:zf-HC2 domain-containing protein [Streptomyces sp. XM83C]|uniref:zf-HC2 domain-containing protein n=1 Tax=unclassified Streptomyces TaxID=2593676 RepID=UPI001FF86669|nr:zf-HC2 domain-containing protein [Streptomyces sp. XM83C]MCK1822328.1 zf-HC2 domain-containing protein [Streptomyces sp. XM83C]
MNEANRSAEPDGPDEGPADENHGKPGEHGKPGAGDGKPTGDDFRHGTTAHDRPAQDGTPHDGPDSPGGRGHDGGTGDGAEGGTPPNREPRIPLPRASVEDTGLPLPPPPAPAPPRLEHGVLKSLLGAWALAACSAEETAAVEEHLGTCGPCADEARRLREAVGLLQRPESLDLDPSLRTRVLASCLDRRPPRIPVPEWARAYDAETARLDALLQDFGDSEWHAPVRLRWFADDEATSRRTTVAGVIAHLVAVDGLVARAMGLEDPLAAAGAEARTPGARTEAYWRASRFPPTRTVRGPWREQNHAIVRTASFTGSSAGGMGISYGDFELPLRDALLDRAFECWVHAEDIAEAVNYPYDPPAPRHLRSMIDLAARMLPLVLAARRQAGLAAPGPGRHLVAAGEPGRSLRLEIEGRGGGEWLIPLDSPAAVGSAEHEVAHIALDGVEFCRLAAGHVPPTEAAAGQVGDREAIKDVLYAAASLSRM